MKRKSLVVAICILSLWLICSPAWADKGAPESVVYRLLNALEDNNFAEAWECLDSGSQQYLVNIVLGSTHTEIANQGIVWDMFSSGTSDVAKLFWNGMKEPMPLDNMLASTAWREQAFVDDLHLVGVPGDTDWLFFVVEEKGQWRISLPRG